MLFVQGVVDIAPSGPVDELNVVVGFRRVESPVGCVGEHDLLLKAVLPALEEHPLVGRANDGRVADESVGVHGQLPVEAGLFYPDDVGDFADAFEPLGAHHDAELGGVVEHDCQGRGLREQRHVLDDLGLGLGHEVRRGDDQQVEPDAVRMVRQRQHLSEGGMGDMGRNGPVAAGLVGHHVVD